MSENMNQKKGGKKKKEKLNFIHLGDQSLKLCL